MNTDRILAAAALLCVPAVFGCSGGSGSGATRQRSSTLTVIANGRGASAMLDGITVGGGMLALGSAMFSIDRITIEENTGEGHEHEHGEGEKGEKGEGEKDNEGENEGEGDEE